MTSIIVRHNPLTNRKMAFVADSVTNKGQMLAWQGGKTEPEIVGVDTYHRTKPVERQEAEQLAKSYAKQFGEQEVYIRERLPRDYLKGVSNYKAPPRQVRQQAAEQAKERKPRVPKEVKELAMQIAQLLAGQK